MSIKIKKSIIWIVIISILLLLTIKILYNFPIFKYPIYKITKDGEGVTDIRTVEIDGIVYESMEDTKWRPYGFDKLIGYAGGTKWGVYNLDDSNKNDFILLKF